MNIDDLTLGQIKELMAKFAPDTADKEDGDGRAVIVRSRDDGVSFGDFAGRVGNTIKLNNARQLWRWKADKGGTLKDVAAYGVDPSGCKFSEAQAQTATIFGACAMIDCTDLARDSIRNTPAGDWS